MRTKLFVLLCLSLALLVPSARAGVVINSVTQEVRVNLALSSQQNTQTNFSDFSRASSLGTIGQYNSAGATYLSDLDLLSYSVQGQAEAHADDGSGTSPAVVATGDSVFDLTFTLDQAYQYAYEVDLSTGIDFIFPDSVLADFKLLQGKTELESHSLNDLLVTSKSAKGSGTLAAGTYNLVAMANANAANLTGFGNVESTFDFTFDLTAVNNPVPEPATMSIFGLLLGTAVVGRRRRRR